MMYFTEGKDSPTTGAKTTEKSLYCNNLISAFFGNLSCAVILHAPAYGGEENKKRAKGKMKTSTALKGKNDTGNCDKQNGNPEPFRYGFFKN